jgi:hypothetical protein
MGLHKHAILSFENSAENLFFDTCCHLFTCIISTHLTFLKIASVMEDSTVWNCFTNTYSLTKVEFGRNCQNAAGWEQGMSYSLCFK